MHILPGKLRSDAQRTAVYAYASVLAFRTNCTTVRGLFVFRNLLKRAEAF